MNESSRANPIGKTSKSVEESELIRSKKVLICKEIKKIKIKI
jgi:hypothetical protein